MNYKLDPGQVIPCTDRCRLTITWMSHIKEVLYKPRVRVSQPISWSRAAILHDSVAIVRTRPLAMSLAMTTISKSIHGYPMPS